ncbi:MAG: hypothetical protein E5V65_15245, partial [Mesorhizobium sp.]
MAVPPDAFCQDRAPTGNQKPVTLHPLFGAVSDGNRFLSFRELLCFLALTQFRAENRFALFLELLGCCSA